MDIIQDRILTNHDGSLPRSIAVTCGVFAEENVEPFDPHDLAEETAEAVKDLVLRQVTAGADLVNDGGFSTFATFGAVDQDMIEAKLGAILQGAGLASETSWGLA